MRWLPNCSSSPSLSSKKSTVICSGSEEEPYFVETKYPDWAYLPHKYLETLLPQQVLNLFLRNLDTCCSRISLKELGLYKTLSNYSHPYIYVNCGSLGPVRIFLYLELYDAMFHWDKTYIHQKRDCD